MVVLAMKLLWFLGLGVPLVAWVGHAAASGIANDEVAWTLLRQPGHVAFMRHSDAPGYADPPGYKVDDCRTQRNLSEAGRAHARRAGEAFRRQGVTFQRALSSPWCRCRDTARLALGRDADVFAPLSNLVGRQQFAEEQVAAIKTFLASLAPDTRALLVTHGVVINALTGLSPSSGELLIVRADSAGNPTVVGRLRIP